MEGYFLRVGFGMVIAGGLILLSPGSSARSYDFYVDGSAEDDGDGSQAAPFKKISELEGKSGSAFVKEGKYKEDIKLKKISLVGEDQKKVIISGSILLGEATKLENLTARAAGTVVTVEAGAGAEIKNCTIEDFGSVGIETLAGGGKLKVSDSKIRNGSGKGFYIQRGKEIEIIDNEIGENDEEGIDIRSKVEGIVSGNTIVGNGESGIEVVVGSAHLEIKKNSIKKNGASGIATQFYSERDKKGKINIVSNAIGNNKKYGLDCNRPQGGHPEDSYWQDSVELEENDISSNKMGAINAYCKLVDAVDENEEQDNSLLEEGYLEDPKDDLELEKNHTPEEDLRIKIEAEEKKKLKDERLAAWEKVLEESERIDEVVEKELEELKGESRWKVFFRGVDSKKIESVLLKLEQKEAQRQELEILLQGVSLEAEEELSLQTRLLDFKEKMSQQRQEIEKRQQVFSLWAWFKGLF